MIYGDSTLAEDSFLCVTRNTKKHRPISAHWVEVMFPAICQLTPSPYVSSLLSKTKSEIHQGVIGSAACWPCTSSKVTDARNTQTFLNNYRLSLEVGFMWWLLAACILPAEATDIGQANLIWQFYFAGCQMPHFSSPTRTRFLPIYKDIIWFLPTTWNLCFRIPVQRCSKEKTYPHKERT